MKLNCSISFSLLSCFRSGKTKFKFSSSGDGRETSLTSIYSLIGAAFISSFSARLYSCSTHARLARFKNQDSNYQPLKAWLSIVLLTAPRTFL
ncbi:MAG: hypothetical protein OMM_14668, partial [Candidatus Magnetoglobus multicellularis str. Araruama]